jgi:threonine/homoserine/homoserine lactone efflux protein
MLLSAVAPRNDNCSSKEMTDRGLPRSVVQKNMSLFLSSFILAIAFCAPPGVITTETVRRGAARGFFPALLVQFGSLVGDTTWAIIALTGLAFIVQNNVAKVVLSVIGILLMLKLAWGAIQDAREEKELETNSINSHRGDFTNGAFLSLGNPMNIVFWTGLGTTVFASISGTPQPADFAIFFAGFFSGAILWCFIMAGIVAWGRKFVTPTFFRWVNFACGLALGFFAIQLGIKLIQNLQ